MNARYYRIGMLWLAGFVLLLGTTLATAQSSSKAAGSTTTKKTTHKSHRRRRPRGQQKMDAKRIREIQDALVRERYLTKGSGKWDVTTQRAMQKYQSDNGWQSKVVPDSRALIKLGLGPDNHHLLNPESAMTTVPPATHTTSAPPEDSKQ